MTREQQLEEALRFAREVERVALTRPYDGSQLDEDLEGLLIGARRLLATPSEEPAHPKRGHEYIGDGLCWCGEPKLPRVRHAK